MSVSYIYMSPIYWSQTIHGGEGGGGHSRVVSTVCRMRDGYDLKISNGDNLVHRVVDLSLLSGEPTEANGSPMEEGVGRVSYVQNVQGKPFVHGWMFLPPDEHEALWHQITSGLFTDSTLDLTVTPIEWDRDEDAVWVIERGPLLIRAVSLGFTRPAKQESPPPPKAGLFARKR